MNGQTYTITVEDIDAYLASKEDTEIVGWTCSGELCLVAQAFYHKYSADIALLVGGGIISIRDKENTKWDDLYLPAEVGDIVDRFDTIAMDNVQSVTKHQWLESQVRA